MKNRLLCVWLPNWPVQRVQAEEPQLAEAPLVLSSRDPRRGMLVAAANLAARREGIKPSMRLSEATALVDTQVREHDDQEDIDVLCSLVEQAQQFSPVVGLEQLDKQLWAGRHMHQPECMLLDITGLANLFNGEANLVNELGAWFSQRNYFACIGVASSTGAAWALANYALRKPIRSHQPEPPAATSVRNSPAPRGAQQVETSAFSVAYDSEDDSQGDDVQTDDEKQLPYVPPPRCFISDPAEEDETLKALPVSALRLPEETVASLHRLGVYTIRQLETLPRAGLATRLGEDLIARWDQIYGRKKEPIVTLHGRPEWCLEHAFEFATQHHATVCEVVRRLGDELSIRLSKNDIGVLRVVCRLDLLNSPPLVMQLGLFRPTNDASHLEMLLQGQLEQLIRTQQLAPVSRISLQATLTSPMLWRQAELFENGESASRNQIARLVDTLSGRLGRKQVLQAAVARESQPELAFTLRPLTGRKRDGSHQSTVKKISTRLARRRADPSRDDPLRRPTYLFSKPVEIEVEVAQQVRTPDQIWPAKRKTPLETSKAFEISRFKFQGVWHRIYETRGPERLESGWWRGPSARRDYYRVVTDRGSWWWLYRDLSNDSWYLHGQFD